eukprot:403372835
MCHNLSLTYSKCSSSKVFQRIKNNLHTILWARGLWVFADTPIITSPLDPQPHLKYRQSKQKLSFSPIIAQVEQTFFTTSNKNTVFSNFLNNNYFIGQMKNSQQSHSLGKKNSYQGNLGIANQITILIYQLKQPNPNNISGYLSRKRAVTKRDAIIMISKQIIQNNNESRQLNQKSEILSATQRSIKGYDDAISIRKKRSSLETANQNQIIPSHQAIHYAAKKNSGLLKKKTLEDSAHLYNLTKQDLKLNKNAYQDYQSVKNKRKYYNLIATKKLMSKDIQNAEKQQQMLLKLDNSLSRNTQLPQIALNSYKIESAQNKQTALPTPKIQNKNPDENYFYMGNLTNQQQARKMAKINSQRYLIQQPKLIQEECSQDYLPKINQKDIEDLENNLPEILRSPKPRFSNEFNQDLEELFAELNQQKSQQRQSKNKSKSKKKSSRNISQNKKTKLNSSNFNQKNTALQNRRGTINQNKDAFIDLETSQLSNKAKEHMKSINNILNSCQSEIEKQFKKSSRKQIKYAYITQNNQEEEENQSEILSVDSILII